MASFARVTNPQLGLTRNVIRSNYALLSPDGQVPSEVPGWTNARICVLISAALGAGFSQWLVDFVEKGQGHGATGDHTWFFFVVRGAAQLNGTTLPSGGFACIPAGHHYDLASVAADTQLLVFRKRYEPLEGTPAPEVFVGNESEVPGEPFLGDPRARLKTLLPGGHAGDFAINIFTFEPGATLPFVETHVMEHGMYFLAGSGVYRLGDDWHPVQNGDALWIAPFCPQWFIAAGPSPARYLYYKDVNRLPR